MQLHFHFKFNIFIFATATTTNGHTECIQNNRTFDSMPLCLKRHWNTHWLCIFGRYYCPKKHVCLWILWVHTTQNVFSYCQQFKCVLFIYIYGHAIFHRLYALCIPSSVENIYIYMCAGDVKDRSKELETYSSGYNKIISGKNTDRIVDWIQNNKVAKCRCAID